MLCPRGTCVSEAWSGRAGRSPGALAPRGPELGFTSESPATFPSDGFMCVTTKGAGRIYLCSVGFGSILRRQHLQKSGFWAPDSGALQGPVGTGPQRSSKRAPGSSEPRTSAQSRAPAPGCGTRRASGSGRVQRGPRRQLLGWRLCPLARRWPALGSWTSCGNAQPCTPLGVRGS